MLMFLVLKTGLWLFKILTVGETGSGYIETLSTNL